MYLTLDLQGWEVFVLVLGVSVQVITVGVCVYIAARVLSTWLFQLGSLKVASRNVSGGSRPRRPHARQQHPQHRHHHRL